MTSGSNGGGEDGECSSKKQGSTRENSPSPNTDQNLEEKSDDTANSPDSKPCTNNSSFSVEDDNVEMVSETTKSVGSDPSLTELKNDRDADAHPQIKTEPFNKETKTNGPASQSAELPNHSMFDEISIKVEPMDTEDVYNSTQNGHATKSNSEEGNDVKPNIAVVVMLSGFSENFVKLAKKYCSALGLAVTSQPKSATHLVKLTKTKNLFKTFS